MMGSMFSLFPLIFGVMFLFVLGIIVSTFVKNARQERSNNLSPKLTVEATVVAKRIHVWGDHSRTNYYATFQVTSGDRMELEVPNSQYGYLVENDHGMLTFQGTRFLIFERR